MGEDLLDIQNIYSNQNPKKGIYSLQQGSNKKEYYLR